MQENVFFNSNSVYRIKLDILKRFCKIFIRLFLKQFPHHLLAGNCKQLDKFVSELYCH